MSEVGQVAVLEVRNAVKRFGSVQALSDVSFQIFPGEIVALLGDNGAGKSTMVKAIAGVFPLDSGEILIDGEPQHFRSPKDAQEKGIETVYQDLALFENLNVTGNFFAGREMAQPAWMKNFGWLNLAAMHKKTRAFLHDLKVNLPDPHAEVGIMSGGQRQAVAVARSVSFGRKILLLDEPTAALGQRESGNVLRLVKELPAKGISVVIISHNLDHVMQVCSRALVLRRGHYIGEQQPTPGNHEAIVSMIVGGASEKGQKGQTNQ